MKFLVNLQNNLMYNKPPNLTHSKNRLKPYQEGIQK